MQNIASKVLIVIILIVIVVFFNTHAKATKITCKSFSTYEQAQALFKSDPVRLKSLDRDHDGRACQSLLRK